MIDTGKEMVEELAQKLLEKGEEYAMEEGKELIKDGEEYAIEEGKELIQEGEQAAENVAKKIEHKVFHDVETAVPCSNEKTLESSSANNETNKRLIIFGTVFVTSVIVIATTFFLIQRL